MKAEECFSLCKFILCVKNRKNEESLLWKSGIIESFLKLSKNMRVDTTVR